MSDVLPGDFFIDVLSDITLIVGVTAVDVFFIEVWKGETSVEFQVASKKGFDDWTTRTTNFVKKLNC